MALAWGLAGAADLAASSPGPAEWEQMLTAPVLPGHRPKALAVDEAGTLFWIESRVDGKGAEEGRIRFQTPSNSASRDEFGPTIPVGTGACALLAWRGTCYLAAPAGLRTIRNDGKAGPDGKVRELPMARNRPAGTDAGFSSLTLGADGRLHGEVEATPAPGEGRGERTGGSRFHLEPDGADFEVVPPGVHHPTAPEFDDAGHAVGADQIADDSSVEDAEWRDKVVATCRDWNGRPYFLLFRDDDRGDPQVEVIARKQEAPARSADEIIRAINEHLDGDPEEKSEALRAFLDHDERRVRWLSAWALTRKGDGLEILAAAAKDGSPKARSAALSGIGILARLGHGLFVPGDDPDFSPIPKPDLARNAALATATFLSHPAAETRVQALKILASAMRPAGLIPYGELLKDSAARVRDQTLLTAGQLGQVAVLDLLPDADEDPPLNLDRLADMMAASFQNDQLIPFRHHPDRRIRWAAMKVLQREPEAGLGYFIFDTDPVVAGDAVLAIEAAGLEDFHPLIAKRISQGLPTDWSEPAKRAAQRCARSADEASGN